MKTKIYKDFEILHFKKLSSSNDQAREIASLERICDKKVIICDIQESGRGRMDRKWVGCEGNLFCSILLKPKKKSARMTDFSFIFAVSLCKTMKDVLNFDKNNQISIKNKWPNDILLNDKKVAGILIESASFGTENPYIIAGIGVNLANNPQKTDFPATNLQEFGLEIDKFDFLYEFLDNFTKFYQIWQDFGFSAICKSWLENAWNLSEEVAVKFENSKKIGNFKGIDSDGSMLLEVFDGAKTSLEKITFGDVC